MRRSVELYINNERVDLFDFEDINIVDKIQDVRDVSKVFVPFSREFTVPASKINNRIFKHYYNDGIIDGYDARFRISAVLKVNGGVYKKGKVTLMGASLKDDKVYSYKLVFYNNTVDLKTLLGGSELRDLNGDYISKFKLEYTPQNVFFGFSLGYKLVVDDLEFNTPTDDIYDPKDLVFPFISTNNYYFYDSNDSGLSPVEGDTESRNISPTANATTSAVNIKKGLKYKINTVGGVDFTDYGAASNAVDVVFTATKDGVESDSNGIVYVDYGVKISDLRGALRVPVIIDAIEEQYGITFDGGFFSESNIEFNNLYLYLQNEKGLYDSGGSVEFLLSDATYDSGDGDLRPLTSIRFGNTTQNRYDIGITITPSIDTDSYNYKIYNEDNGVLIIEGSATGEQTVNIGAQSVNTPSYVSNPKVVVSELKSTSVDFVVNIINWDINPFPYNDEIIGEAQYSGTETVDLEYRVVDNFPKMKIIDFLTGLFNMFNLTAYTNSDGNIVVETLDQYYGQGNVVDITRYVDSSKKDVNRMDLYSEIEFKYEDASTFAVQNSNEFTGEEFGNERFENTEEDPILNQILAFDGGRYGVEPKIEKVMYERMTDQSDETFYTNVGWGWMVDKDQKPVLPKPLLFYAIRENIQNSTPNRIAFDSFDSGYLAVAHYRPSNSLSTDVVLGQSLNFGSEYDEYAYDLGSNEKSLFNVYWRNYINSIYDKQARVVSLSAYLPVKLINTLQLNDEVVIRGKSYRINKLDVNITTGKTKLELITKYDIESFYNFSIDSELATLDSNLITADSS